MLFFTTVGIMNADPGLLKIARSFNTDASTLLFKVSLPAAIPSIFVGMRIAALLVFFVLIGAEMLGTDSGLGWLVHNSGMNYQIKGIYAAAFTVVLVGYAFARFLYWLESRIFEVWRTSDAVTGPDADQSNGVHQQDESQRGKSNRPNIAKPDFDPIRLLASVNAPALVTVARRSRL
jgi:ABC-type Fe3+ transport system permease subunit